MPDELNAQMKWHVSDLTRRLDDARAESARLREVLRAFMPPCEEGSYRRPCKGIATHYYHHADHTTSHYCRRHAARHGEASEFKFAAEAEALLAKGDAR